jgi:hypothetical protein
VKTSRRSVTVFHQQHEFRLSASIEAVGAAAGDLSKQKRYQEMGVVQYNVQLTAQINN